MYIQRRGENEGKSHAVHAETRQVQTVPTYYCTHTQGSTYMASTAVDGQRPHRKYVVGLALMFSYPMVKHLRADARLVLSLLVPWSFLVEAQYFPGLLEHTMGHIYRLLLRSPHFSASNANPQNPSLAAAGPAGQESVMLTHYYKC